MTTPPILQLRVALTTQDYDRLVKFYCDGLGLEPSALWTTEKTRAMMLEMGSGTLELFDEAHAESVDRIETEKRTSGQIRFALQVPDLDAALARLVSKGVTVVHPPVITPWNDYNVRVQDPDGMQVTLFQVLEKKDNETQE
jgi:catechol 2,3-dioxygenase-like lactoylglutathione lyase family enzyme